MFAHLRVTRGNESIFQFKVYGSVSYPRQYCNIYGSSRLYVPQVRGRCGFEPTRPGASSMSLYKGLPFYIYVLTQLVAYLWFQHRLYVPQVRGRCGFEPTRPGAYIKAHRCQSSCIYSIMYKIFHYPAFPNHGSISSMEEQRYPQPQRCSGYSVEG